MVVDELILKLQADLSDVKKALKDVENQAGKAGKDAGATMGKAAGSSFSDVFNAIAGAAVANTVKNFFSRAATEFNKMEAAFLRVDSIAKGFGRSVDLARKNVDDLANKGFLNLNQSASAYADAIALGFDETKAKKFVESLSDIAAFQNTIGDGAAAVQSGLSGLLSNSAEKVENIGVPIKVLNQEYQKNIATMGKAAAMQKFYNGVLKESSKFAGDAAKAVDTLKGAQDGYTAATDKAMAAVGKGLEPTLKAFYKTLASLAEGFARWFGGLDSGSKSIVLFGGALTAIVPAVLAVGKALALLSFNPVILTIAAIVAATTAIAVAVNELSTKYKPENIVKRYKESADEAKKLGDRVEQLNAINKRTITQELELVKSKEELRKKAQALGLDYDTLSAKAKNYSDVIDAINNKARDTAAADIDRERMRLATNVRDYDRMIQNAERATGRNIKDLAQSGAVLPGGFTARGLVQGREEAQAKQREADLKRAGLYASEGGGVAPASGGGGGGKTSPEFRFIEARDQLKKLNDEYKEYLKTTKDPALRAEAAEKLGIGSAQIRGQLRQSLAEYNEQTTMAALEGARVAHNQQIANIYELANIEGTEKEKVLEQIKEAEESYIRKNAKIQAESFARTMQAAQASTQGFTQLASARDLGAGVSGLGNTASGISGFSEKLAPLGKLGLGVAAAGGIFAGLSALFGKSDEQRVREAEAQKRRDEEAKAILELQANYQKNMLALQEAAAKLPFENLQREMRLADIQGQQRKLAGEDPSAVDASVRSQKLALAQGVLSSQAGTISEGELFAGTGSTPESLIAFMSKRAEQALAVSQFNALIQSTQDPNMSYMRIREVLKIAQQYSGKIPSTLFNSGIAGLQAVEDMFADPRNFDVSGSFMETREEAEARVQAVQSGVWSKVAAARTDAERLMSEISRDTGVAENLLSVLEQSNTLQLEIAGNTKKTADNTALRPDRERSFIDVGQGFIQSLGQRVNGSSAVGIAQNLRNLTLPSEVGFASSTSVRARTLQERMADALEMQLRQGATANDILRDIRAAAVELLAVMDGDPATGRGMTLTEFSSLQSEAARRRF